MLDYGVGLHGWDLPMRSYSKFAEVLLDFTEPRSMTDHHIDHQYTADRIYAFHSLHKGLDLTSIASNLRSS